MVKQVRLFPERINRSQPLSFFNELKRRNVFKVAAAYIIVGWLIMQAGEVMGPALRLPEWVNSLLAFFLILGFPLAMFFAWAYEMTPEGLRKEKEVDRSQSITQRTGRKLDFVIIGLLAVGVIYLLWDKFLAAPDMTDPAAVTETVQASPDTPAVVAAPAKSIAVLPFANMSDDASNEFFSEGISEEILNALAHVKELKVAGRTSSFAFKGRNEDLRLIGETLNVSHILEGSVRKAGNTVRITAQLIAVEDGYHVWSDTYDRELNDIFAIQDEIAAAILRELKAALVGEESLASSRTDPRAYEKYLLAKQRAYTRSRPELENAVELLNEALELDPGFAPAWAQRGILSMLLADRQYGTIPYADSQAQAKQFLEHALEIDDGLAEAWAGLGLYHSNETGPEHAAAAWEHLERALEINPSLINASNWLYGLFVDEYRAKEALLVLEDMFERDPLYRPLIGNMGLSYLRLGRLDKFSAMLDRLRPFLRGQPHFDMGEAMLRSGYGKNAEALPFAEAAFQGAPANQFVVGALGRSLFFLNEFDRMLGLPWTTAFFKVPALNYLGRNEEAAMLARQHFEATGQFVPLFNSMVNTGQYEELASFVEEHWSGLDEFNEAQQVNFGFGNLNMLYIAKACLETGRLQKYEQAMKIVRADHDQQTAQGAAWVLFYHAEAYYWTLANDHDRAIKFLERAVNEGWRAAPRISRLFPILKPLEGDPRFEEIQSRVLQSLNRDRVEAGLEPLPPAYSL
jgi:TolB-like protein